MNILFVLFLYQVNWQINPYIVLFQDINSDETERQWIWKREPLELYEAGVIMNWDKNDFLIHSQVSYGSYNQWTGSHNFEEIKTAGTHIKSMYFQYKNIKAGLDMNPLFIYYLRFSRPDFFIFYNRISHGEGENFYRKIFISYTYEKEFLKLTPALQNGTGNYPDISFAISLKGLSSGIYFDANRNDTLDISSVFLSFKIERDPLYIMPIFNYSFNNSTGFFIEGGIKTGKVLIGSTFELFNDAETTENNITMEFIPQIKYNISDNIYMKLQYYYENNNTVDDFIRVIIVGWL